MFISSFRFGFVSGKRILNLTVTISNKTFVDRSVPINTKENAIYKPLKRYAIIAKRNISLETKLCKQPLANYQLSMNGHLLIVKMGNKQEEYPFFLRPIIEAILKNNENGIALKDIPHNFGETEMVKLVKRLVSEGIFKIVE